MDVNANEIGLREGRARFGDLVNRAQYGGEITIITKHGRPAAAIVPINRIAKEPAMTVPALADELNVTRADVLALVDQLAGLDGSENVVVSEEGGAVTLTAEAAETIREQLAGKTSYTLTIVGGPDYRTSNGVDITSDESPISYGDLDDETTAWLEEHGFSPERPELWVLVTPASEDPAAPNAIAARPVTI